MRPNLHSISSEALAHDVLVCSTPHRMGVQTGKPWLLGSASLKLKDTEHFGRDRTG